MRCNNKWNTKEIHIFHDTLWNYNYSIHASYVFLKICPQVDGSMYIWIKSKSAARYSTYFLSKVDWMISIKAFVLHNRNYLYWQVSFLRFQYTVWELKLGHEQI